MSNQYSKEVVATVLQQYFEASSEATQKKVFQSMGSFLPEKICSILEDKLTQSIKDQKEVINQHLRNYQEDRVTFDEMVDKVSEKNIQHSMELQHLTQEVLAEHAQELEQFVADNFKMVSQTLQSIGYDELKDPEINGIG